MNWTHRKLLFRLVVIFQIHILIFSLSPYPLVSSIKQDMTITWIHSCDLFPKMVATLEYPRLVAAAIAKIYHLC